MSPQTTKKLDVFTADLAGLSELKSLEIGQLSFIVPVVTTGYI